MQNLPISFWLCRVGGEKLTDFHVWAPLLFYTRPLVTSHGTAAVYSARPRVAARGPDGSNGGAGQRWRHPGPWNRAANEASRSFHSAPTSTAFSQLCLTMLNRHVNSVSKCEIGMLVSKDHSQQAVWLASLKQLVVAFNQEKVLIGAFSGRCETSRRFVDSSRRHPGPWTRVIRSSAALVTTDRCTPLQLHWGE